MSILILEDVMNDLSSMVSYKGQEKKLEMVFSIAPDVHINLLGNLNSSCWLIW